RLSIIHQEPFSDNDESTPLWPTSLLDAFVNLTSLCVSPLTDKICDFIVSADVNLIDFRAQVNFDAEITTNKVVDMFLAPSLRNLQHLRFTVDVVIDGLGRSWYQRLLHAITTNLDSLEEICFAMALNVSWCRQISYLINLKKLVWYIPDNDNYELEDLLFGTDSEWPTRTIYEEMEYEKANGLVARAFDAAFEHLISKPFIKTDIVDFDDVYDDWRVLMTMDSQELFH